MSASDSKAESSTPDCWVIIKNTKNYPARMAYGKSEQTFSPNQTQKLKKSLLPQEGIPFPLVKVREEEM